MKSRRPEDRARGGAFAALTDRMPFDLASRLLIYLSVLLIPAANAPITADTLEVKFHLFRIMGVAAAVLWAALVLRRPELFPIEGASLAVLMSAVVLAASLMMSESRVAALPSALDAICSLSILCLVKAAFGGLHRREHASLTDPLMAAIGVSAVLPALLFVAETFRIGISDTLGNQNVVSHFLLMTFCAPIYFFLRWRERPPSAGRRWVMGLSAACLAALLIVLWKTAARGALVGLLVSISLSLAFMAARHWKNFSRAAKIIVVLLCVISVLAAPALLYRYAASKDFNVSVRFLAWKYSISLLSERLLLGYGPGLFSSSFEKTKLWISDEDANVLGLLNVNYAHNDYVELAVEQGALGLSAFLFLIVAVAAGPVQSVIRGDAFSSQTSLALLFSVSASLAQAFFDFPYHTPAPRFLFYVLLGLLWLRSDLPKVAGESQPANPPGEAAIYSWYKAAMILIVACLPAIFLMSIYAASTISKAADPQFKAGHYAAVRHLQNWSAELNPSSSLYPFRRGLGEEQAGDPDAARRSFRAALFLQPYFPNSYFHLGNLSLSSEPAKATSFFSASIAFSPQSAPLHNLAAAALALGDTPVAMAVYTELARRYPDDDRARTNAGVLSMMGRRQMPELYRTALELYQANHLDQAANLAKKFLDEHPGHPEGLFLLGRIYFHQQRYKESEQVFKDFLALRPADPEGHYYMGNVHFFQDQMESSLESYRQASKLNPDSPKILYNLGVSYYSLGDFQSMNDCFDTVLSINPNVSNKDKIEELRQRAARKLRLPDGKLAP